MGKKRANGEGTLRQRKDGRWECAIMLGYRDDGRRRIKTFYGHTRKAVLEKVQKWRRDIGDGIDCNADYTFEEWADMWFELHKSNISPTTQEGYRYTLRILKERFGGQKLVAIKVYHVELFLRDMRQQGRADSSIAKFRGMLYQIFNKAEANDLIRKNPVRFAEKIRSKNLPKEKDTFTAEEIRLLFANLPHDRLGNSIRLLLGTGMRTQELLALQPYHIAEDGSYIYIRQAVNLVKGTVSIGPPKSRDGYRDIPIPPSLHACAAAFRNTDRKFIWEVGKVDIPCNPSYFRDKFREALAAIPGVRLLTPHCCRHTYVSQMQALGVDLPTLQSIVGHADIDMTQHYLHIQRAVRESAVAKFSEAFSVV